MDMNIDSPTGSNILSLRSLWKEAFGDSDEFLDSFFSTAYSEKRCRCITDQSDVLSALYWFDCVADGEKVAYIYAVATLESQRGTGLCAMLMKNTHEHLCKLGYVGAILVPGSVKLFDFYEKLGYKICSKVKNFESCASGEKIEITKINSYDYAMLRRKFLPENSVVQENENISFLETMNDFYKGEDFLMVAKKRGDALHCAELLGNSDRAAAIVNSFACKNGFFRTPGDETPFTMYISLDNNLKNMPSYFGLAFD